MSDSRWMAYSDRVMNHMTWRAAYARGYREPHFPVPVIPLKVEYHLKGVRIWDLSKYDWSQYSEDEWERILEQ